MTSYGYCRVSTAEQDLQIQQEWAKRKGVAEDHIFAEKRSGAHASDREELQKLLTVLDKGEVVHIYKLDRLARNTRDSLAIMDSVRSKGATLEFGDIGRIDTSQFGEMLYTMVSAMAQMERKTIVERTRAGRDFQRKNNPNYREGRPRKLTAFQVTQIAKRVDGGEPVTDVAKSFGVDRKTVYRYLSEFRKRGEEDAKMG